VLRVEAGLFLAARGDLALALDLGRVRDLLGQSPGSKLLIFPTIPAAIAALRKPTG
jgi:hypothetical protein